MSFTLPVELLCAVYVCVCYLEIVNQYSNPSVKIAGQGELVHVMAVFPNIPVQKGGPGNGVAVGPRKSIYTEVIQKSVAVVMCFRAWPPLPAGG